MWRLYGSRNRRLRIGRIREQLLVARRQIARRMAARASTARSRRRKPEATTRSARHVLHNPLPAMWRGPNLRGFNSSLVELAERPCPFQSLWRGDRSMVVETCCRNAAVRSTNFRNRPVSTRWSRCPQGPRNNWSVPHNRLTSRFTDARAFWSGGCRLESRRNALIAAQFAPISAALESDISAKSPPLPGTRINPHGERK